MTVVSQAAALPATTVELAGHLCRTTVGTALYSAVLHDAARTRGDQLHEATARRAVIEQAKGVLMAQHGLDADAAFARLAAISRNGNIKVSHVAGDLIARLSDGPSTP